MVHLARLGDRADRGSHGSRRGLGRPAIGWFLGARGCARPRAIGCTSLCPPGPAACLGDFNTDSTVNSADFFDFLTAFFTLSPAADFNRDGSVNSQDYFDFIGAFFAGGC